MEHNVTPKPGPHLHQPSTLAELAELHARHAHDLLTVFAGEAHEDFDSRFAAAEAHAAVARACAHAAIARRSHVHTNARPLDEWINAAVSASLAARDREAAS